MSKNIPLIVGLSLMPTMMYATVPLCTNSVLSSVSFSVVAAPVEHPTTTGAGGGGGGGGSASAGTSSVSVTLSPVTIPQTQTSTTPTAQTHTAIFSEFSPVCSIKILDLSDPRLLDYAKTLQVQFSLRTMMTRAEFVEAVIRSTGADVSGEQVSPYSDVTATNPSSKYIAYAARMGIIDSRAEFRPTDRITRAEAAKVLVVGLAVPLSKTVHTFDDVATTNSLSSYIQTAYDNCILHGRETLGGKTVLQSGATVFEADDGITVAEVLKVLYNLNR